MDLTLQARVDLGDLLATEPLHCVSIEAGLHRRVNGVCPGFQGQSVAREEEWGAKQGASLDTHKAKIK